MIYSESRGGKKALWVIAPLSVHIKRKSFLVDVFCATSFFKVVVYTYGCKACTFHKISAKPHKYDRRLPISPKHILFHLPCLKSYQFPTFIVHSYILYKNKNKNTRKVYVFISMDKSKNRVKKKRDERGHRSRRCRHMCPLNRPTIRKWEKLAWKIKTP